MAHVYGDPAGGTESTIEGTGSTQMNKFLWQRRALIEAAKDMYFSQIADTTTMPKHFGKEIKVYHYIPLLDARNVNDQGIDAAGAVTAHGNLYGSSKDVGLITSRLPLLGETGGRVNRVGFTRLMITGSLHKFGIFTEFSQEALDFDSDADLYQHISRELVTGATQLTEAVLQKDLLAAAGTIVYAGAATSNATITAEGAGAAIVDYEDLMRLDRILTDNRTPKQTKVIKGSQMIDTVTIPSGRIAYVGSELSSTLKAMTDLFGNPAFIPVQKYAAAGTVLRGEIGTIDQFRIVEVPEMLHWAGVGATVGTNPGYRATSGNYDVFPMLVVGAESFTTISFHISGKEMKFKIITKMPGEKTADRDDPYGELGFSSLKWFYGFMGLRPERIGLIKTVARI